MPTRKLFIFLTVFLVVFATRLPYVQHGYGNDADAWDLAKTAQAIATTGEYRISRPPGHPLQEVVSAMFWEYGPEGLNGITALLSALGAGCFGLILLKLRPGSSILGGLAIALTPVIWIHSTDLTDYIWAWAFLVASLHEVLHRRCISGGLLLALAISCRITTAAAVLPMSVIIYLYDRNPRQVLLVALISGVLGLLAYLPAYLAHGDFIFTIWSHGYPRVHTLLYMMTVGVWGLLGTLAIAVSLSHRLASFQNDTVEPSSKPILVGSVIAILAFVALFLRLPHEVGYLVPIVPFVFLILVCLLDQRAFRGVCACVICSSLLFGFHQKERLAGQNLDTPASFSFNLRGIEMVFDPLRGPVPYDAAIRSGSIEMVGELLAANRDEDRKVVFVTGGLLHIVQDQGGCSSGNVEFRMFLTEEDSRHFTTEGYDIYYLMDVHKRYNKARNGVDLDELGAQFVGEYEAFAQ